MNNFAYLIYSISEFSLIFGDIFFDALQQIDKF